MQSQVIKPILLLTGALVAVGLIVEIMALLMPLRPFSDAVAVVMSIARIVALGWLIYHGSTRHSRWIIPIVLALLVLLVGIAFKIMHWPGAGLMLIGSLGAVVTLYSLAFWQKQQKALLDYAKLLWLVISVLITATILFHWADGYYIRPVPRMLFWLLVALFVYQRSKDMKVAEV